MNNSESKIHEQKLEVLNKADALVEKYRHLKNATAPSIGVCFGKDAYVVGQNRFYLDENGIIQERQIDE